MLALAEALLYSKDMPTTYTYALEGHVVEFSRQPSSTATGIIGNVPPVRIIARVNHRRYADGSQYLAITPEGGKVVVNVEDITADLGPATAGWGSW